MRATRAYVASLGTTGLLVFGAVTILVAAGALIAFHGWPSGGVPDRAAAVVFDSARQAARESGPDRVAALAAPGADEIALAQAPADSAPAPPGGVPGDDPGSERRPESERPDGPPAPAPDPGGPTDGPTVVPSKPPPPTGGGVTLPGGGVLLPNGSLNVVGGAGDALENATGQLGSNVVSPLSPELGDAVTGTGRLLGEILRAPGGSTRSAEGLPAPPLG